MLAYKCSNMISIIQKILELSDYNVLLLARNSNQIKNVKKKFGKKITSFRACC